MLSVCTEGLDRSLGLQVPSDSAGGSAGWVVASLLTARSAVPKSNTKRPPPEFCHILTSSSGSQVHFLKIWDPGVHGGSSSEKRIHSNYCRYFTNSNPGHLCFVMEFQAFKFQLICFSLSPEESLLTPQSYRVFWGTSRFNYKRAKTNTVFLQNSHFSWKEISCVWPFGKGNSQLIF